MGLSGVVGDLPCGLGLPWRLGEEGDRDQESGVSGWGMVGNVSRGGGGVLLGEGLGDTNSWYVVVW